MKKLMSTLFVIAAVAGMAVAADNPDFSGQWKLDVDKSAFGPTPPPTAMTRKVDHKDPALSVETSTSGPQGDQNATFKYTTDGKETTNSMMGNDVKCKAAWEGKTLIITNTANFGGADVKFIQKWALSEDGKTLTDNTNISAPQGDFEITYVFVKQ